MSDPTRRVWRAGPATLTLVSIVATAAAATIGFLAYLIYREDDQLWIPLGLVVATMLVLAYAWRFGLHPKLRIDNDTVQVVNPFRRYDFDWDDITVIAPGENGLLVASEDIQAEAWCIQKSNYAARRGRLTRADRVADQLIDVLELHDPPLEDEQTGLRIRRSRPHEARLLTRLERAASEDTLSHVFPPEEYPFPVNSVARRWRKTMVDRHARSFLLEAGDSPVGYVCFDATTVRHLGVDRSQVRRGYGSALLEFATREIYAGGHLDAELWVLVDNADARSFYRHHGWTETDERLKAGYPPHPETMLLRRRNPSAPRRSR